MVRFYHGKIDLDIPETIYYPREDSMLLAKVLEKEHLRGKSVLEVGCGSGFLSILMTKLGGKVTAIDINEEAVVTAGINAKINDAVVDIFISDLFARVKNKYDIIVFNPPYLPVDEGETDLTYAGGLTGRETIERFIVDVKHHMNVNGTVLLLISSLTGEKEVLDLFEKENMDAEVITREKIPWEELIVFRARSTATKS